MIEALTSDCVRPACAQRCAFLAPHAMQAHRLWIKLCIPLGQPAKNRKQSVGNAAVTARVRVAAHSPTASGTQGLHRACERLPRPSPAATTVIPSIHRPYYDYQTSYVSTINRQVAPSDPPSHKEEGDR
jgi:hypothetical protein